MDIIKNNITTIALNLFANKGFLDTSMQDIASACNISKATIYKYFPSKEDVVLAAILAVNETALLECREINNNATLTDLEKLRKKIIVLFLIYQKKSEFISNAQYQLEGKHASLFMPEIKASHIALYSDINKSIADAFDLVPMEHSWDMFLVLKGSLQEISAFHKFISAPLDPQRVSDFLMDSLSAIVAARSSKEPLITQAVSDHFKKYKREIPCINKENEIIFLIEKMRSEIIKFPETTNQKKLKALAILEQALCKTRQEEDENMMSEAMLSYLGESEPLKPFIGQLKKLLNV